MSAAAPAAAHTFKVVVAGAFGVGKSTLIRQISDSEVVGTEAPTSGSEAAVKPTTTVGMEYGTFTLVGDDDGDGAVELRLHGLPGQERFRFMWDIVSIGADGVLLLVDATRPETWAEAADVAGHLGGPAGPPLLVGVNRAGAVAGGVDAVARALSLPADRCSPCEVIDPDEAKAAVVDLLLLVLDELDRGASSGPEDPEGDLLAGLGFDELDLQVDLDAVAIDPEPTVTTPWTTA